jgi:hypothetical protein
VWLNGLAFTRRLQNYALIKQEEVSKSAVLFSEYWAVDPVHMSSEGYLDLARKLMKRMVETELNRPTRANQQAGGQQQQCGGLGGLEI